MERGRIQGLPIFGGTHIILGMEKARDFKLGKFIHRVHLMDRVNKLKFLIWSVGTIRTKAY